MEPEISYEINKVVTVSQFQGVLDRSGLAARRPVEDPACLEGMLRHANLTISAWEGEVLVGIARSVTDFHYCCYLSDLAVDRALQGQGIGRRLIHLTQSRLGSRCQLLLLSAPAAVDYYPHLGFERHPQAWLLDRNKRVVTEG